MVSKWVVGWATNKVANLVEMKACYLVVCSGAWMAGLKVSRMVACWVEYRMWWVYLMEQLSVRWHGELR